MTRWIHRLVALLALLGLAACSGGEERTPTPPPRPASTELNFYNWEDYILRDLLEEFRKTEGVTVHLFTYPDEDDILASLQSGLHDADLVVVSNNIVQELHQARLIQPLDTELIPNLDNARLHPRYGVLRGDEQVAAPYMLGTVGVVVNTRRVPADAESWDVLWNPDYKGHLAMLDNSLDVIDAGLKSLGYSINTENPREIAAMRAKLLAQAPLLAGYFDPVTMIAKLKSGELWAAQLYNGDALSAMEKNPDLRYYVPVEGSTLWMDCLVVPRFAPHPDAAMRFIDFLLRPGVMARNAAYLWYQPVNAPAIDLLPRELLESPEAFPPPDVLDRCESTLPISPEAMRSRLAAWAELRGAN